jgi:photosystem II stability/assembly factor-like uncharacterized protein
MRVLLTVLLAIVLTQVQAPFTWSSVSTGVSARLRGVSAVSDRVAWASGTTGTILRTADGGVTWQRLTIAGTEKLDFRDIDAVDDGTAYALSIGPGELSRIYKRPTRASRAEIVNRDRRLFDAMAFWDANRAWR